MLLFEQNWLGAILRILISFGAIFGVLVYMMVWAERKISAWIQDRIGPNRVGPFGLLQGLADGIKFIFKEEIKPQNCHRFLYTLAPFLAVFPAVLAFGVVPFGAREIGGEIKPLVVADIDAGILFTLSIASLGVFSILLAGWSSNSKYPVIGGLRAGAQVISYEVPMGLAVLAVLLLAGSARLSDIVTMQNTHGWFLFLCPLGFFVFLSSIFAETNRLPFDLPEGETEIVGYHAEYSSMKFAMFFMAEYANMITVSCLTVLMFFGGWEFLPFCGWNQVSTFLGRSIYADPILWLVPTIWFCLKVFFFLFLFIWVRWTLPRFRYDQLMALSWKKLIPIGVVNLVTTIILVTKLS